jgi:hypothetical protein
MIFWKLNNSLNSYKSNAFKYKNLFDLNLKNKKLKLMKQKNIVKMNETVIYTISFSFLMIIY